MSEANFKSELLKQNGRSAVDEEVSKLRDIIAVEQRRVRRLTLWTIGVWAVWFVLIGVSLGIPVVSRTAAPRPGTSQPAVAPAYGGSPSGAMAVVLVVLAIVDVAGVLGLPIAGIVLAIMLIVTRRTASMNQVRVSLASIDAQLRMLGAPGVKVD